jgi:signal transduction histidine kinase
MRRTLGVLLVSDADEAATRIARELSRGGYDAEIVRVADAEALEARLSAPGAQWAVVLSDQAASLSALDALAAVRHFSEETALVVVRFDAELDTYVDTIPRQEGASRLCAAMDRVVHEAQLRAQQRELRDQILVSERLASVGFLVAGIAHEINNPLSAVIANQEYVRSELTRLGGAGQEVKDALGALDDAILSTSLIRQVVRDLHTFSRTDSEDLEILDPRAVLESALRMTWYEIRDRARLTRDLRPAPRVRANLARMSQVFLNLLINAAQSIKPGRPDSNEIRAITRTDEHDNFVAEIHDTGSGIAPEHMPFIFDPFFTTKPPGTGTGLGLAVSHRLVARYGGTISVTTKVGKGSVFSVTLPPAAGR